MHPRIIFFCTVSISCVSVCGCACVRVWVCVCPRVYVCACVCVRVLVCSRRSTEVFFYPACRLLCTSLVLPRGYPQRAGGGVLGHQGHAPPLTPAARDGRQRRSFVAFCNYGFSPPSNSIFSLFWIGPQSKKNMYISIPQIR